MGKASDRESHALFIGLIGVLITVVGWFLTDKSHQIDKHLEAADAERTAIRERVLILEYKTAKIR